MKNGGAPTSGLAPGTRLGPYEIVAAIGAGGMGEVYRARDTKLNRTVALKILPELFTHDADRLARFRREAQVLAALSHPNIAGIYGFEDSPSTLPQGQGRPEESRGATSSGQAVVYALAMEFVDGDDLSAIIGRGPMPLDEAMPIAKQIIAALEAAHEQGIVHRDLKPQNVKVTADGTVKVLDFGLAKAMDPGTLGPSDPSNSPTLTARATQMGMILGTAAYMSPEQARGRAVDKRTDVWALGCVLYEMLSGKRAFTGDDATEVISAVMKTDPDWNALPASLPPHVRSIVMHCLVKDRKDRVPDVSVVRFALDGALASTGAVAVAQTPMPMTSRTHLLPWAVAAIAMLALAALAFVHFGERQVEQPLVRLDVDLGAELSSPQGSNFAGPAGGSSIAISPDGMRLAYLSGAPTKLVTRRLNQREATELAGTHGASAPFFSPDGQWIGFQAGGKVNKISVEGGAVVPLTEVGSIASAGWCEDGTILLGGTKGITRIPGGGGTPQTVVSPGNGEVLLFPQLLPRGTAVLFSSYTMLAPSIDVVTLADHQRKTVSRSGTSPRYLETSDGTGYLVYANKNTLFAVPFDLAALETRGTAVPVLDDVALFGPLGAAQYSFSRTGTLVYRASLNGSGEPNQTLHLLEASGQPQPLPGLEPALYRRLRLSTDGRRLAEIVRSEDQADLWIRDLQADRRARLTFKGNADTPAWAPDGGHLAYALSLPGKTGAIYWVRADGAGEPWLLLEKDGAHPDAFSPDGKWLVYHQHAGNFGTTMWRLPLDATDPEHPKAGPPGSFLEESSNQEYAAFSPDGRWIAYKARDAGRDDVFVRPSSGAVVKFLISSSVGGTHPVWSRNGHELFYLGSDGRIQLVDYSVQGDSFVAGKSRPWSSVQLIMGASMFDLMPDGKRMLMALNHDPTDRGRSKTTLTMLLNFFDELRRKAPTGK